MAYVKNKEGETKLGAYIRKAESDYISGTTTISKYVEKSMYDDLNTIDAYLNSKHISGPVDAMGRDKPFFNIVTAAVNIWYRSTTILLNKIKIRATVSRNIVLSFVATILLHDFFRRSKFSSFLSDWGIALSRYGSAVVKFVEKDGLLYVEVVPWSRLIVDPIDFDSNPKIEILELTEAQLRKRKGYDKAMVESLCDARTARTLVGRQRQDNKNDYIRLYEVHGEFPLSYLTGNEEDEETYVQQMHVISFVATEKKGKYDDFTLVSGKESKDPYMITHLIKEEGQTLSIGAVQHLFEAQWMMNHTVKYIKDQLDLASKLVFQTSDPNYVGQNVLNAIQNGDILVHAPNQPLTQVANNSHDITSLQNFGSQWKALSNELTGISESMLGNTAPSGTAWRQVETLLQENKSLFEVMRDNKGIYIEQMLREYIIPFIKKKMDTSDEIAAILDENNIKKIDTMYINREATKQVNRKIIDSLLKGETVTPEQQGMMMNQVASGIQQGLKEQGDQRFIVPSDIKDVTWKDMLKDFEWEEEVDTTDNTVDKDAMTTLNTMLATIARNPMVLQDPTMKFVFNKILSLSGAVSPIELPQSSPTPSVQAPAAVPQTLT